jgi:DNA-binding transcriptional LysR family regulator
VDTSLISSGVTVAQLETVVAVVDYGSYTAAADVLGISQPSLTRRIQTLEELVGSPVFLRSGRRMTLTGVGERLCVAARRALRELTAVNGLVASTRELSTGSLRLIGLPSLLATVVPGYLGRFHRKYPGVDLEIFAGRDTEELFDAVRLGRADGAVGPTHDVPDDLSVTFWQHQRFCAVLPRDGISQGSSSTSEQEARTAPTGEADLAGEMARRTLVTLPRGTSIRAATDEAYRGQAATPPRTITTTQRDMLVPLAVAAGGLTVVPRELARVPGSAPGTAIPIDVPVQRDIGMIYRRDAGQNPAFAQLLQLLPGGEQPR